MIVTFSIEYRALPNERIWLQRQLSPDSSLDATKAFPLEDLGDGRWQTTLDLPHSPSFCYSYYLGGPEGKPLRREWRIKHTLPSTVVGKHLFTQDRWIDQPADAPSFSRALCDVLYQRRGEADGLTSSTPYLAFSVFAPSLRPEEGLFISGASPLLGSWEADEALPLSYLGQGRWMISLPLPLGTELGEAVALSYKYLIRTTEGGWLWEEGANREAMLPTGASYDGIHFQDSFLHLPTRSIRTAGIVAPLFSLRSEQDWGIGDFATLREAIDLVAEAEMHALQLLPINDTTFARDKGDSYPYNAISVDALHPIYADLSELGGLSDPARQQAFEEEAAELRSLPQVDYPRVLALKERYLRAAFAERGSTELASLDFSAFFAESEHWLRPYALYCVLRDQHSGVPPSHWAGWEQYDALRAATFAEKPEVREEIRYYYWLQFVLDRQLRAVRRYAEERRVFLKGDLPIGVAPHGVDVWIDPSLFHTDQSAGAPPDDFAADGQNWGFPTYDWERMQTDDFGWWRKRFARQAHYFHAFRIDHILGFFRIWEVPRSEHSGLLGHFHPALPYTLGEWQELLGVDFPVELLTQPLIYRADLAEVLGESALEALCQQGYLKETSLEDFYHLLHTKQCDYDQPQLKEALGEEACLQLQQLCTETSLIRDPYSEGYHPRIALERSRLFGRWDAELQGRWQAVSGDFFYVRHNELFQQTALRRLGALIEHTDLLLCAEDLGMIPATVPAVLEALQILSLELERMPKSFTPTGWADPKAFPSRSIATTSTHDMPSLRGWWSALPKSEQERYLSEELKQEEPLSEEELYRKIVAAHLDSPALATILPLSDWMSLEHRLWLTSPEDEQINHPEDPAQYWSYRFPLSVSSLRQHYPEWLTLIKQFISHSQRI